MDKTIVFDFDGIFSDRYFYNDNGGKISKNMKSFGFGARHALELLSNYGFKFYVITGDSTIKGQNITKSFLGKLPIEEVIISKSYDKLGIIKKKFDISKIIYVGDDLYDYEIFQEVLRGYTIADVPFVSEFKPYSLINVNSNSYTILHIAKDILKYYYGAEWFTLASSFIHKKHSENFHEYVQDKRFNKILFIQQYSMRNHSDGTYNLLLDGNLNLTLHRISSINNHNAVVHITIPKNHNKEQFAILKEFVANTDILPKIEFVELDYGENALENRKVVVNNFDFNSYFQTHYFDLIVSDFSNFKSNIPKSKLIYNYNISKVEKLNRWYVDDFFDEQLKAILNNKPDYVYVLNENQKEYFIDNVETNEDRAIIDSMVVVDKQLFNRSFFDEQVKFFDKYSNYKSIITQLVKHKNKKIVFFPFRLSDECYAINELINHCKRNYEDFIILTTDPNESIDALNDDHIVKLDFGNSIEKKANYLLLITELQKHYNMKVLCYESPYKVLHQSLIEMYYSPIDIAFMCDTEKNTEFMFNMTRPE
jgi:3-deoxy-D-manno-octulosonate 8-phosphate phosphatase KdsC-like HAD superfamily phosphatase